MSLHAFACHWFIHVYPVYPGAIHAWSTCNTINTLELRLLPSARTALSGSQAVLMMATAASSQRPSRHTERATWESRRGETPLEVASICNAFAAWSSRYPGQVATSLHVWILFYSPVAIQRKGSCRHDKAALSSLSVSANKKLFKSFAGFSHAQNK